MTDFATFKLRGVENLDQKIRELEPRLSRSILRSAVRKGANLVRDKARALAPVDKGALRRGIRTVLRRGKPGSTVASVGVLRSSGARTKGPGRWPYYASWVERGHRIVARRGRHGRRLGTRGHVAGRPFLLPALVASQSAAQAAIMDEIASRLGELVLL